MVVQDLFPYFSWLKILADDNLWGKESFQSFSCEENLKLTDKVWLCWEQGCAQLWLTNVPAPGAASLHAGCSARPGTGEQLHVSSCTLLEFCGVGVAR